MPNDSNWISLTCKVILYERLCNKIGFQAMGNIMQLLASRLLSFPQITSLPVSLCGHVYTTNTATGKGRHHWHMPIPWAGRKQLPSLIQV